MPYNFSITFPCKPYTRVFIEQNYGKPVRFYKDKGVMTLVRLGLSRKDRHNNHLTPSTKVFSDEVTFYLTEDDYNRYGGELTYNSILFLNQLFEDRTKKMMLAFCSAQYTYGMKPFDTISLFQEKFGFTEQIWKFESIYKHCQRNTAFKKTYRQEMQEKISKIVLEKLSAERTITNQAKITYEEN